MIPALDTDLKSDFQLFGDSGWYHFVNTLKIQKMKLLEFIVLHVTSITYQRLTSLV